MSLGIRVSWVVKKHITMHMCCAGRGTHTKKKSVSQVGECILLAI